MGTFVDNGPGGDGKAYLIRSVQNQYAGISQMTSVSAAPRRERM